MDILEIDSTVLGTKYLEEGREHKQCNNGKKKHLNKTIGKMGIIIYTYMSCFRVAY